MIWRRIVLCMAVHILLLGSSAQCDDSLSKRVQASLNHAGDNRDQLVAALEKTPASQLEGMQFLIAHMPDRDLKNLAAEFLLENVRLAYEALEHTPWKENLPKDVFLNNVLPYASINERRDNWRKDFHQRFKPLIQEAKSPGEAAAILNQKIFPLLKVRYSTKRAKANQSPYESIESGLASCTGLSVVLVDACRSVGVPARFVGTPLWSNKSGNHSWVEIWDDGWHFTGAAEPNGNELDRAWFAGRAASAQRDHQLHAIYAVSYKRTPLHFPLVWNPHVKDVFAVNVTDRYTRRGEKLPEHHVRVMFKIRRAHGERCAAAVSVRCGDKVIFSGTSNDERFDANNHLTAILPQNQRFSVEVRFGDEALFRTFRTQEKEVLLNLDLESPQR